MVTIDLAMNNGQMSGLRGVAQAIARNQFLWAVLLAILVKSTGITLPSAIIEALDFVGSAAAPVAIFAVGGILARTKLQGLIFLALLGSVGKLMVLPFLALVFGRLIGLEGETLSILVLFMAMPNASIFPIFGERANFPELAASVFVLSYTLAFFTLSAWMRWLP